MIKIHLSRILGARRMSQIELARKTGIRPAAINEYYHELVDRVNLEYISRICDILECEIGDLLEYIPGERPPREPRRRRNE